MKIKNLESLATTLERRVALQIGEKGLEAIDTRAVLEGNLRITGNALGQNLSAFGKNFQLSAGGKLVVVCIGKCAADAAETFEKVLGDRITSGVALGVGDYNAVNSNSKSPLGIIKYHAGTHPMPSDANVAGTKAILDAIANLTAHDTVLFLISGGGSTLLIQPPHISDNSKSVDEETSLLKALFKAGATIQEINTVRKHISLARGGFLAATAYPAQVISIIFSDVPGNDIQFIASGPTVKDVTTVNDAEDVVKKYDLSFPTEALIETPKDDRYFAKAHNILAVSNELAVSEMKKEAEMLDYAVTVKNTSITGEAGEVGKQIASDVKGSPAGTVLLYSGETTVTIKGADGRGGRNQELALGALGELGGPTSITILSLASDGRDNGPHAGALADTGLAVASKAKNLDPDRFLARNDSSAFFESVGDGLIETGDTGSNVSDLMIAVVGK